MIEVAEKKLVYDEQHHAYFLDGRLLPSVTGLLPEDAGLSFVSEDVLESARAEGVRNHRLVEAVFGRADLPGEMTDRDRAYFKTARDFFQRDWAGQNLGDPIAIEEALASDRYGFAGRPDQLYSSGPLDVKRRIHSKRRLALQCAGYDILGEENGYYSSPSQAYWILEIDPDTRTHKLINVFNPEARNTFLACVQKHRSERAIHYYMKSAFAA